MLMKNKAQQDLKIPTCVLTDADAYTSEYVIIPAGEEFDCKLGYCVPRRNRNGSRKPSIMEFLCMFGGKAQVEPVNDRERKIWLKTPKRDWEKGLPNPFAVQVEGAVSGAAEIYRGAARLRKSQVEDKLVEPDDGAPQRLKSRKKSRG